MKSFITFSVSFLAALILFAAVAVLCLGLSYGVGEADDNSSVAEHIDGEKDDALPPSSILVIFENDNDLHLCLLDMFIKNGFVTAEYVDCSTNIEDVTLKNHYEQNGAFCLADAVSKLFDKEKIKYIKITPKTFEKIADRTGNLVYNDSKGNEMLLTSTQAVDLIDSDSFAPLCKQVAKNVIKSDILDNFQFAVSLCENDFSYPSLHRRLYE